MTTQSKRGRHGWLAVLLWMVFGAGLLVQASAPRLRIKNNTFVIPPSLVTEGKDIHPAELIARARRMQLLSGVLTLGGAVGLAFYYRRVLVRPRSLRREPMLGGPQAS